MMATTAFCSLLLASSLTLMSTLLLSVLKRPFSILVSQVFLSSFLPSPCTRSVERVRHRHQHLLHRRRRRRRQSLICRQQHFFASPSNLQSHDLLSLSSLLSLPATNELWAELMLKCSNSRALKSRKSSLSQIDSGEGGRGAFFPLKKLLVFPNRVCLCNILYTHTHKRHPSSGHRIWSKGENAFVCVSTDNRTWSSWKWQIAIEILILANNEGGDVHSWTEIGGARSRKGVRRLRGQMCGLDIYPQRETS